MELKYNCTNKSYKKNLIISVVVLMLSGTMADMSMFSAMLFQIVLSAALLISLVGTIYFGIKLRNYDYPDAYWHLRNEIENRREAFREETIKKAQMLL